MTSENHLDRTERAEGDTLAVVGELRVFRHVENATLEIGKLTILI